MVALEVESWTWWGFVILVGASRFISRRMILGGFRLFQADDYVMAVALCFYTSLVATINIVRFTNSNLLPPGYDVAGLSQQDIHEREYGSKLILVVEQSSIVAIWGAKVCLIIMYMRLTTLRREHIAIKVLAAYVAVGFVTMEILYFGVWCRPFTNYWAVPTPSVQCDAATNHLITNATLNLSSDLAMIAIGLPMFLKLQLPWRKKIPLVGIFSLGFFVILAAILNKVYSFSEPFGSLWTYWYVRESSTALLVANLPFVWTFWRRVTGSATVNGTSRRGSTMDALSRMETNRKESVPRSPQDLWLDDFNDTGGYSGDVAMDERRRKPSAAMTFDDMLSEGDAEQVGGANVSPFTHPRLFYGKQSLPQSPTQKAVVREGNEQEVVRRDSSPEDRLREGTAASSGLQRSLTSEKSMGSFL